MAEAPARPAAQPQRAPAQAAQPAPRPTPAQSQSAGNARPAQAQPAAPRAEQQRPSAPANTERRPAAPSAPQRPAGDARAPQQPNPGKEPSPDRAEGQSGGGWVRDLLRGASRDDLPVTKPGADAAPAKSDRSALHVVESLNSLSVDIARAIDHDASIELWERYRRGERNVFTRRLYTLKGQQTFDEIRRKYQADSEFRNAVDQYCRDFEKLLKDVARSDRDNMMTQTYLSSDTGKVYTMLAHASGRLR